MKIGICGSYSTGKTSLITKLQEEVCFKDFFFDISHERKLHEIGYKTGKNSSVEFQNTLLYKELYNLNIHKNYITDTPLPLCQAYSDFYKKYNNQSYVDYHLLCMHIAKSIIMYDVFFYTGTDVELVDDGLRDMDFKFREDVDKILKKYLKSLNISVLYLPNKFEDRIKLVNNYMSI